MFSFLSKYLSKDNKSFCLSTKLFIVEGEHVAGLTTRVTAKAGEAGAAPSALHSPGIPRDLVVLQEVVVLLLPMPWMGYPPAPLLWPHSKCLWRKCQISGRVLFPSRRWVFAISLYATGSGSWWWYYEEEESSHLLCNSPSSPVCIADILMHQWRLRCITSWYLECLQLLTRAVWSHMFWMVEFPVGAQVMWRQTWDRCI